MMRAEPDATPALVTAMAEFNMKLHPGPPGSPESPGPRVLELLKVRTELAKRLIEKPRVQQAWSYLRRAQVQEPYVLAQWQLMNAVAKIPDDDASSAEKAAALLLHCAVNVFSGRFPVWLRGEIEQKAEPLRATASLCRTAAVNYPRARKQDAELADSLLKAAEYFEIQWKMNVRPDPFVVDRTGDRDEHRTRTRALASEMCKLYGRSNYGSLAKIASAALKDDTIGLTRVREWCS
jgi:hypothetical protein